MLRAVLFDLDNTLIDFISFKEKTAMSAARAMVEHGLRPYGDDIIDSEDELRDMIVEIRRENIKRRTMADNDLMEFGNFLADCEGRLYELIFDIYDEEGWEFEQTYTEVVKRFDLDENHKEKVKQAAIVAHQSIMAEALQPYPFVLPVLRELKKKLRLAIVSDAPRHKAWKRLVMAGLADEFDVVVTQDDTNRIKPAPENFRLALERLGHHPTSCLFVGDNPGRDIKGANSLGMHTCLARYGLWNRTEKAKAHYEIRGFSELLTVVARIDNGILDRMLEDRRLCRMWNKAMKAKLNMRRVKMAVDRLRWRS